LFYTYVWQLDFLTGKIERSVTFLDSRQSRLGSFIYHFSSLSLSPISGVSIPFSIQEMDLDYAAKIRSVSSNGISIVFFTLGLPFGFIFFYFLIKGIVNLFYLSPNFHKSKKILMYSFIALFLLLSFSQDVTLRMFSFYLLALSQIKVYKQYV
jgi:hypothetical protein